MFFSQYDEIFVKPMYGKPYVSALLEEQELA